MSRYKRNEERISKTKTSKGRNGGGRSYSHSGGKNRHASRKDAITSVRGSPGDGGVISGIVETGTMVLCGAAESPKAWQRFETVNVLTNDRDCIYHINIPTAQWESPLFSVTGDVVMALAEISVRAGTSRPTIGEGTYKYYDDDYAGKDLTAHYSKPDKRQVPRQRTGRFQGKAVPCYQPKNFSVGFVVALCKMFNVVPPWRKGEGVVLVGETTDYLEKEMNIPRVSYTDLRTQVLSEPEEDQFEDEGYPEHCECGARLVLSREDGYVCAAGCDDRGEEE